MKRKKLSFRRRLEKVYDEYFTIENIFNVVIGAFCLILALLFICFVPAFFY